MIGTLQVNGPAQPTGAEITGTLPALIIDEIPVLAAIAPYTRDGMVIRNARELRVKESDRIALVVRNLRAMGAEVEEFEDGMRIPGGQTLHGGVIDSADDHRIAMAFSVAALRATGDTQIDGANACPPRSASLRSPSRSSSPCSGRSATSKRAKSLQDDRCC